MVVLDLQRTCVAGLAIALTSASAFAADPSAAALYDEGVRKFAQSDYEGAADAFLRADQAKESTQALLNAIAAGRRGHAHLLVARAAQRALSRDGASADLTRLSREALVEAAQHLARIDLTCTPAATSAACDLSIDGSAAPTGLHYLLPGTHRFTGVTKKGGRDEQPLTCNAGATYTVALRPADPVSVAPTATVVLSGSATAPDASSSSTPSGGVPRPVVYVGAGVAAVLAGVAVWSGVDSIQAKQALPAVPLRAQNDDVLGRAHRTDALIAAASIAAIATAVLAIWFVPWSAPRAPKIAIGVGPSPEGAAAVVKGRF